MDPKEPGAASNAPVEEPAKLSELQEPGTAVVDASNQPEPKEPASAEGQASQKVGAKPQKPGDEKKSLKERWQEAKALRAAAKKDGKGKDGNILKNFARVFTFGDRLDFTMQGLCVLTAIGSGIAMPLMFVVFGRLVGHFTGFFTPGSGVTAEEFMKQVVQNTLYMVYIGTARLVMDYISMLTIRMSGLRVSAKLRLAYLTALFRQPVSVIDQASPGKIASRLTTNSNTIQKAISQQLAQLIQALTLTIALYVTAFIKGPLLTLVASASLPLTIIIYSIAIPFAFGTQRKAERIREQASALAFEVLESIRIVHAFGAEERLGNAHNDFLDRARVLERKNGVWTGFFFAPMFFSTYATFALTFWFGIKQVLSGHLQGIASVVVNFVASSIGRLIGPIMGILNAASAAAELFIAIDSPVPSMKGLKDPDVSATKDIELRDVSFAYPTRAETAVLKNLNVRFEAGKTTAIVGPSGSGKSTIVGLIQRWYEPTDPKDIKPEKADNASSHESEKEKGDEASDSVEKSQDSGVFVGGVRLDAVDIQWWRMNVGLVQQEPFLFNDTIFNNVANGLSGTKYNGLPKEEKMEMVKNACDEAFASGFISRLPEGYDTFVGESGIKISGGQRQRLSIARAIIKQPPVLILDEATSSIDVRTEKIVQQALDRVSEGRTTITIAHRLSTIKRADKIVVLRGGEVVEEGSHSKLLENQDGIYSGLVRAQEIEMGDEDQAGDIQQDESEQFRKEDELGEKDTELQLVEEKEWKPRGVIRSLGMLLYEQRRNWFLYTLAILAGIVGGAAYPIQSYLFAHLVNVFTLTGEPLKTQGDFWSLMFFILALAVAAAYFIIGWTTKLISIIVSTTYRKEYLVNILRKRIVFFDRAGKSPGTLTARMSTDATQIQELIGLNSGMALISIWNLIGSITISFYFGWKLALVGVFTIMPIVLMAGYFRFKLEHGFEKLNQAVFKESSQFGAEAISAYRTVTSLMMEDKLLVRFDDLLKDQARKAFRKARLNTFILSFSDTADMFCQALCFYYGGTLLSKREYDPVQFFVIYMSAIQGAQAAGTFFSFSPNLSEATAAANRIISIRPTKAELADKRKEMPPGEGAVGIEFKDVDFTYPDRNVKVLNNLSIKIEPGQFAALVGASGCGKSTIISLIERFYDPTNGQILFGDTSIVDVDTKSYRRNLSLVAQESTLYEGTIRDNVALSVEVDEATDDAIEHACKSAQIHDFITSLSEGYNTIIGPRGIALSGGQRQRVALARALLRRPQALLLDEATSNLDSESERQVQMAIERAAGDTGCTVLAVAHRLATIQNADVIFVIGSGKVLETGSHAQLIAKRGVYFQMCQAQALDR